MLLSVMLKLELVMQIGIIQYFFASWSEWVAETGENLILKVPMFPLSEETNASLIIEQGAVGDFNIYFYNLSASLVNNGLSKTLIRVAPDFNDPNSPWCTGNSPYWISYYAQITAMIKSIPGTRISIGLESGGWSSWC